VSRPDLHKLAKIYHLPTTGTPQSYPSTPDVTTTGEFFPMDLKTHALEGGDYVNPYQLKVRRNIDVRTGDKVVVSIEINGAQSEANFYVKKVTSYPFGSGPCKVVSLSTASTSA
jgi:hypothetical protein